MDYKVKQRQLNMVEFLYMGSMIGSSYIAMILKGQGMDSVTVGSIQSALALIGLIAPPIAGMLADKMGSVRKMFVITFTVTAIFWLAMPTTAAIKLAGVPLMVFVLFVEAWIRLPIGSLMDGWLMDVQEKDNRIVYSAARKYGSLGYAIFSFLSSYVVAIVAPEYIYYFMPLCALPVLWLCKQLGDGGDVPKVKQQKEKLQIGRIFKKYYIMTYFLCSIVVWMPFMVSYTLLPYLISDMGGADTVMGIAIGLRALMEVPAYMLVPMISKRLSPRIVLPLCFAYYAVEQLLCSFLGGTTILIALLMVSGMVYAVMQATTVGYVHSMAPKGLGATVVTMNGAVMSLSSILGNLLCGVLIAAVGIRMCYVIIGGMTAVFAALFVLFLLIGKKKKIAL
ncbi:MAG: MFS transporter [Clostridiales bacterium]|nr:MFS transporter [Clostridiales bacterium]